MPLLIGRAIELTGHHSTWFVGKNIFEVVIDQPEISVCVKRAMAGENCSQKEQEWKGRYYEIVRPSGIKNWNNVH